MMKKPTQEIERLNEWANNDHCILYPVLGKCVDDIRAILAYIDSILEWPYDLDRARVTKLARDMGTRALGSVERDAQDALFRLALLAPTREKRKVEIWQHRGTGGLHVADPDELMNPYWIKKWEGEIDA